MITGVLIERQKLVALIFSRFSFYQRINPNFMGAFAIYKNAKIVIDKKLLKTEMKKDTLTMWYII